MTMFNMDHVSGRKHKRSDPCSPMAGSDSRAIIIHNHTTYAWAFRNNVSNHKVLMWRKPFLALCVRALPDGGVYDEPSRLDGEESPHCRGAGCFFFKWSALAKETMLTFTSSHSAYRVLTLAPSQGGTNYDTLRYLPIRERNLFSFFGGPLDISFNSSV
jgi:hypothetical protein